MHSMVFEICGDDWMTRLIDITGKALAGEWGTDDEMGMGIPVLRTTNFTNEGIVNFDNVVTRTITKKAIENKFLRPGDIILEKSGGSDKQPVGRVIYFDGPPKTYLFNNFTGLLRIQDQKKWYPRYVFYSLFSNYWKGGTRAYENKTTGLHNLKTDDYVSGYNVADADYSRQVEICNYLDEITKIIRLRQQELSKFDDLIKARFVELFGTLDNPSQEFAKATLKELCNKITDGKHGGCTQQEGTERYFVGAREIFDDEIHYDTAPQISVEEFEKDYKRCNVEIGDFLIVNTGATIGKSAIASDTRTTHTLLQKSVALLKVKKEVLNPIFLKWCYKVNTKMYLVESASAQPNLLLSKINSTVIYVPDINLQNQFAEFVKQVDKSKFYEPHWRKTYRMAF